MEHNEIVGIIPWPIAIVTGLWFGMMAFKAKKNAVLWAIGGAVLGLIVTTLVLGLAQAMFIPMVDSQVFPFRIKITLLAAFLVFVAGWLFAGSIHPHLLALGKRPVEPAPAIATEPVKAPVDVRKQP